MKETSSISPSHSPQRYHPLRPPPRSYGHTLVPTYSRYQLTTRMKRPASPNLFPPMKHPPPANPADHYPPPRPMPLKNTKIKVPIFSPLIQSTPDTPFPNQKSPFPSGSLSPALISRSFLHPPPIHNTRPRQDGMPIQTLVRGPGMPGTGGTEGIRDHAFSWSLQDIPDAGGASG
jgi:hypothetical protein